MANPNLKDEAVRKKIIQEIKGEENKKRKAESLRRFEVFCERQDRYVIEKLESEFSSKTVQDMRKVLSINLCPRIINQLANIYVNEPVREFSETTDQQKETLNHIYEDAKADTKMLLANKYYKLNDQCAIQVVVKDGVFKIKVMLPHQYDVIPQEDDVEKPYAYIVSVFDKFEYLSTNNDSDLANPGVGGFSLKSKELLDGQNQTVADSEDYKASLERYEVWTDELNFIMDGAGNIVSGEDILNPIGSLPFVDIAGEKDSEFFVRRGNGIVNFAIDFAAQLSDVANIIRLQGYAQAIVYADKQPQNMTVGPNHILFMQIDPNRPDVVPKFEFANPGSDLESAQKFLEMTLRLFLTSKGIDPKAITGTGDAQSFTSGLERLLSMIDKFEASRSDINLFKCAEREINDIILKWIEAYQGTDLLDKRYQTGALPDAMEFSINYSKPESVQTKTEQEDSAIKLLDKALITRLDAIKRVHNVDDEIAEEMLEDIKKDKELTMPTVVAVPAEEEVVTQ